FFVLSSALLARLHLRHRFRVVHVHSLPDFQVFCAVPEKALGARVVLDLHEAMPEILAARLRVPLSSPLSRFALTLERLSCSFADRVVLVTDQRFRLLSRRGLDPRKGVVVMNSPDRDPLALPPTEPLRAKLGLDGRWVLVQAGGVNEERDLETLIRAAGVLNASHPSTVILFGRGDAGYRERLRMIASAEAPSLDFRLEDWVPPEDVLRYVGLSDVGVVTYERNPLTELAAPHKVFEFVAARRPLVLADLEGLLSVWDDAAVYYTPGDPVDLAAKIRRVIEEPGLPEQLVAAAKTVYERCAWPHSRDALVRMYADLAGGPEASA
ncbi:MAG: hypothetical protein A2W26_11905, partial [Acidobacteria bacterium RBG_16_64_8]